MYWFLCCIDAIVWIGCAYYYYFCCFFLHVSTQISNELLYHFSVAFLPSVIDLYIYIYVFKIAANFFGIYKAQNSQCFGHIWLPEINTRRLIHEIYALHLNACYLIITDFILGFISTVFVRACTVCVCVCVVHFPLHLFMMKFVGHFGFIRINWPQNYPHNIIVR